MNLALTMHVACGNCRQVGHALETYSDHDLAARLMTADDRK